MVWAVAGTFSGGRIGPKMTCSNITRHMDLMVYSSEVVVAFLEVNSIHVAEFRKGCEIFLNRGITKGRV